MHPESSRSLLCAFGHVASHAELLKVLHGQESALLPLRMYGGTGARLRTGIYVCAHLSEEERLAAWCGGRLDCVTVLEELDLPVSDRGEPHLRLPRGHGRVSERFHLDAAPAHAHWSRLRYPPSTLDDARASMARGEAADRLRTPVFEALRQALTSCLSYGESAQLLDAMSGSYPAADLAEAIRLAPRRVELALRRIGGLPREIRTALDTLAQGNHF